MVGPVSGLVQVPQAYTTAIETALGFAAQNIVVEQERSARDAIRILRERNGGRATFLPLDTLQPRQIREGDLEDNEGFVGIASHLVRTQDRYRVVAEFLLGNILVAQDLSCASRISARYRRPLPGSDPGRAGNQSRRFLYWGGSRVSSGGFFTRSNQISQLESEARQLRDRYEQGKPRQEAVGGGNPCPAIPTGRGKGPAEQAGRDQTEARVRAGGLESALKEQENQLASLEKERQGARERREALEQLSQRSGSRMEEALEQEKNAAANLALLSSGRRPIRPRPGRQTRPCSSCGWNWSP